MYHTSIFLNVTVEDMDEIPAEALHVSCHCLSEGINSKLNSCSTYLCLLTVTMLEVCGTAKYLCSISGTYALHPKGLWR